MLRVGLRLYARLNLPCALTNITSTARALTPTSCCPYNGASNSRSESLLASFWNKTNPHRNALIKTMASSSPTPPSKPPASPIAPAEPASSLQKLPNTTLKTTDIVMIYVTVPEKVVGTTIAHALVTEKLAACTNILPGIESIYFWDGKVHTDEELLLLIKTRASLVPEVTNRVKEMHPYDECEVVAVPVVGGSGSYLQWVKGCTKDSTNTAG